MLLIYSVYNLLLMDPSVPIIPIRLFLVVSMAAIAPGFTTPITGISNSFSMVLRANALAVLHATTIAFTSFVLRKCTICLEYLIIVFLDLLP